jgi:tetratricopeptide (TPR) repeat protein
MKRSSALRELPGGEEAVLHSPGRYSTKDVAALLGLSPAQVSAYVRAGFLTPETGPKGEHLFSFQDVVLLRTAKGLLAGKVPRRRVKVALERLREQLPADRPLTGVRILAEGHHVVVRDDGEVWEPASGQALLDFEVSDLAREAAVFSRRQPAETETAGDLCQQAASLEADAPDEALATYERALALDPQLAEAHLNLGRLLHDRGDLPAAERHYRLALAAHPDDPLAAFNLGVALQDQGKLEAAVTAYEEALAGDQSLADAHYNLSGVYETLGKKQAALRHLSTYRRLTR